MSGLPLKSTTAEQMDAVRAVCHQTVVARIERDMQMLDMLIADIPLQIEASTAEMNVNLNLSEAVDVQKTKAYHV